MSFNCEVIMKRSDAPQKALFYSRKLEDEDVLLCFASDEEWLSRRQLAERVWRKVTPDFKARLERLVSEGKLIKTTDVLPNKREMFWYKRAGGQS
jgi:hypothetical protein